MFHHRVHAPAVRLLALLSLGMLSCGLLSGCTTGDGSSVPGGSPSAAADAGSDLGNGRPTVTFDGELVRRRVALAVEADADLPALRARLEQRASAVQLVLTEISPDVLPAGVLEQGVPQLTVLVSSGATEAQTLALIESGATTLDQYFVLTVLVHDLRFQIRAADPAALAESIEREGILSDALGNYGTTVSDGLLSVTYLGALLGDDVIASVRGGIARSAGTEAGLVTVAPGAPGGAGVNMATEPEPAAVVIADSETDHGHDVATVASAAGSAATPTGASLTAWSVYASGLAVLLMGSIATLLWMVRRRGPTTVSEPEPPDRETP
jgi:hypothetical protein